MNFHIKRRIHSIISQPERNLRMTLFALLYAFLGVASPLPIKQRIVLNPAYNIYIAVGFIFALLFCIGIFMKYSQDKNAKSVYLKYKIEVID